MVTPKRTSTRSKRSTVDTGGPGSAVPIPKTLSARESLQDGGGARSWEFMARLRHWSRLLDRLRIRGPVPICGCDVPGPVDRPERVGNTAVVEIEFAVDDLPSRRIDVGDAIERHRVRAVPAVLRQVLLGVRLEEITIVDGGESVRRPLPRLREFVGPWSWLTGREVRDRIIALQSDSVHDVHRVHRSWRRAGHSDAGGAGKQRNREKDPNHTHSGSRTEGHHVSVSFRELSRSLPVKSPVPLLDARRTSALRARIEFRSVCPFFYNSVTPSSVRTRSVKGDVAITASRRLRTADRTPLPARG